MSLKRNHKRREQRTRLGVAATELAVCLPVIVLLVVATVEACSMVFVKQSLTVTAYEGVRTALVKGSTATDVENTCNQILLDRRIDGATVTITPRNIPSLSPGDYVDVTITAPCDQNTIVPNGFYRGRNLSATASMMIEF
jgi:Flp pilus assembly protein TadG